MSNWFETLDGLHAFAWQMLGRGVADAKHPARHPTFATISPDNWPEARTVVLRRADPDRRELEVHTDLLSHKIQSLKVVNRAAFHVWINQERLQIRAQAEVTIHSGEDVTELWSKVPDHSRQSYGVRPGPGSVIETALDYRKVPDPATFAVLRCSLVHLDLVHLGEVHRRARFTRARDWAGEWLAP